MDRSLARADDLSVFGAIPPEIYSSVSPLRDRMELSSSTRFGWSETDLATFTGSYLSPTQHQPWIKTEDDVSLLVYKRKCRTKTVPDTAYGEIRLTDSNSALKVSMNDDQKQESHSSSQSSTELVLTRDHHSEFSHLRGRNARIACGHCHRAKQKCDDQRPCGRCVQSKRSGCVDRDKSIRMCSELTLCL